MKRFFWAIPLGLVLMSLCANADTITTIHLLPNDGSGDNLGFIQQSPNATITIHAGVAFYFFDAFGYTPGSTVGGLTDVFFDLGSIETGGTSHDLAFNDGPGSLFMSSITLPTDGADGFAVQVVLVFSASAINIDTGQPINIFQAATGTASFSLFDGIYYPADITATTTTSTVPEPGALGLVGTGVLSILAIVRKKLTV